MRVGGGSGGGDLWVGAFVSRKCRVIAMCRRKAGHMAWAVARGIFPWPPRQSIAPPYAPEPGLRWNRKMSPCEWRRFYRRNPMALHVAQYETRKPQSGACNLYARHLERLNLMPVYGPMNRAPKDGP